MRFFLLFLLGCPNSSTDTAEGGGKTPAFEPAEGSWNGGDYTVKQDSCGLFEAGTDQTDLDVYTLELRQSGGFDLSVAQDDFTVTWNCGLSGKSFDCPEQVLFIQDSDDVEATVTGTGAVAGTFSSETAATVDISVVADCSGGDCGTIEAVAGIEFPCLAGINQPVSHAK